MRITLLFTSLFFLTLNLYARDKSESSEHFRGSRVKETRHSERHFRLPTRDLHFTSLSQVDSPLFNGQQLQATSVDLEGKLMAVGYNYAGEISAGGVDLFEWKNEKFLPLGSLYSEDFEISSLKIINPSILVAVGSAKDLGAALFIFSISSGTPKILSQLEMPGFYASAMDWDQEHHVMLVASGDNAGSFEIDLKNFESPQIRKFFPQDYLLSVGRSDGIQIQLVSGSQTNLLAMNREGKSVVDQFMCANTVEAPAGLFIFRDLIASNACPGEFRIYDFNNREKKFSLVSFFTLSGKGNGIEAVNDWDRNFTLFFLAQGESGVKVLSYQERTKVLGNVGDLESGDEGSSNGVFVRKVREGYLIFVPSGRKGIRAYLGT